tara:strand:+ start:329 stop:961 length:633 start_codon:yes stop_codon:yes gene_type:complete
MAINKRTYPNDYFAWYNDDSRLAIVSKDTTNDSSDRTSEKYDSFQGDGDLSGTISTFVDYNGTVSGTTKVTCSASHDLVTGDRVTISSSPDSYYDGNYSITKVDADEFYFTKAYSAEDSGTFTSLFINDGLRITYHSKYESVSAQSHDLQTAAGVDSGLHPAIVCFVKARLYEDQGDMERAMYFRKIYEKAVMQYPSRKSGVRTLAVPHM